MAKAKAKRANSEGSIYQVADGTWMAAVLIGRDPSTGKLKGKYLRAATRQEAHQRLLHAQGQSISGRLGESPTITMSAWLDLYWHDYVWPNPALVNTSFTLVGSEADLVWETLARPAPRAAWCIEVGPQSVRVKVCQSSGLRWSNKVGFIPHRRKQCSDAVWPHRSERTTDLAEKIFRVHVIPTLGHLRIEQVRREHVQRWYNSRVREGLSVSTADKYLQVLRRVFQQAIHNDLISHNPCEHIVHIETPEREYDFLSFSEARAFLDSLEDDPWAPAWALALYAGLRFGELCGLRWQDIDLDAGQIHVQ
jgi:hypothetical protein